MRFDRLHRPTRGERDLFIGVSLGNHLCRGLFCTHVISLDMHTVCTREVVGSNLLFLSSSAKCGCGHFRKRLYSWINIYRLALSSFGNQYAYRLRAVELVIFGVNSISRLFALLSRGGFDIPASLTYTGFMERLCLANGAVLV